VIEEQEPAPRLDAGIVFEAEVLSALGGRSGGPSGMKRRRC